MNPATATAPASASARALGNRVDAAGPADAQRPSSCVFECRVLHHRFAPRDHRFAYRLFYLCLDLDELPRLGNLRLLAFNRPGLFSIAERDFLPTGEPLHQPLHSPLGSACPVPGAASPRLKDRVLAFCAAHGARLRPDARVQLVTLPRLLGYQFNPVSFYFCFDRDGTPRAAIAEVTNTFREVKPYFLPLDSSSASAPTFRLRVPKHFYVSPFSPVDLEFDFTLRVPGRRLAVQIDDYEAGRRMLHTTLTGERAELSDRRLAWCFLRYPLVTVAVIARIHWQAARLWLKRLPVFRKAAAAARQRDLYRPHPSISHRPAA